jgi:hypothetical protein
MCDCTMTPASVKQKQASYRKVGSLTAEWNSRLDLCQRLRNVGDEVAGIFHA